ENHVCERMTSFINEKKEAITPTQELPAHACDHIVSKGRTTNAMAAGTLIMNRSNVSGGWRITSNNAPKVRIHKRASAPNVLTNALFTDVSVVFNTFSSIA